MGLMTRLTTLLRADAHGVVDALEDQALTLRQHLREAEAELDRKRCRAEALENEEKSLRTESSHLDVRRRELETDIDLALGQEQEKLARFAIRKLLPLRRRDEQIEHALRALGDERSELEQRLAEQEETLEELRGKVRAYLARHERSHENTSRSQLTPCIEPVSDEEVELELLRRRASEPPDAVAAGGA